MEKLGTKNKKRIFYLFIACALLLALLGFRLAWIQIVTGEELHQKAVEQQTKDVSIEAKRGDIYDRNGIELATSATCYTLWARPTQIKKEYGEQKCREYAQKIGDILNIKTDEILEKFNKKVALIKIEKYIEKDDAEKIRKLGISGLELAEGNKRYYPMGKLASKLLGSVTDDNVGRSGIELEYDQYLCGLSGRWIKNTDASGDELSFGTESYYAAENGYDIVSTVDEVIQYYMESALETGMKNTKSDRMMGIAMSPKTGDILAMAVTPGFDPNNATEPMDKNELKNFNKLTESKQIDYLNKMWRNPLISDTYEPGSTFKLLTASSALEAGVTTTSEKFNCNGSFNVDGITLHCADNIAHGTQELKDAVGNSCNEVHANLALRLGAKSLYEYLDLYGITNVTGIDYPGEASAIIQARKDIGNVELATIGYGQGIAVTPIQLITAISAIGNKGMLMKPRIVKEMKDQSGNVVKKMDSKIIRRVISEETAKEMCEIMEYEVSVGGGGNAKIEGYRVGGKTGTANKAVNGTYSEEVYSSFICMAPMDDPQIAVLVICDNPKGLKYGSFTSAPVAKDILENTLKYMEIQPIYTEEEQKELSGNSVKVPNVVGKEIEEAVGVMGGCNIEASVKGSGKKVLEQYPKAAENVSKGSTVYLYTE